MTTCIFLSNFNWIKCSPGPTIVLSTMVAPGEDFLYLFVLSPAAASKLSPSHQIKKLAWEILPSKAGTVFALPQHGVRCALPEYP
jgi:hypothetical protein